jgi:hypothetical protein
MFARSFEAYLNYAGRKAGIKNNTLFSTKYGSGVYPTDKEMEKLYPLFRSFLNAARIKIQGLKIKSLKSSPQELRLYRLFKRK